MQEPSPRESVRRRVREGLAVGGGGTLEGVDDDDALVFVRAEGADGTTLAGLLKDLTRGLTFASIRVGAPALVTLGRGSAPEDPHLDPRFLVLPQRKDVDGQVLVSTRDRIEFLFGDGEEFLLGHAVVVRLVEFLVFVSRWLWSADLGDPLVDLDSPAEYAVLVGSDAVSEVDVQAEVFDLVLGDISLLLDLLELDALGQLDYARSFPQVVLVDEDDLPLLELLSVDTKRMPVLLALSPVRSSHVYLHEDYSDE